MVRSLGVLALAVSTFAVPLQAREWTDSTGVFKVEADLAGVQGDSVRLRKPDGTEVTVPLVRLSAADQQFLRSLTTPGPAAERKTSVAALRRALAADTRLEFIETPLTDVLSYLQELHQIPIVLDVRGLDDCGLDANMPITANINGLPLAEALDRMLSAKELVWLIRHDVLFIAPRIEMEATYEPRVYRVLKPTDIKQLAADVMKKVQPQRWDRVGGPGTIKALSPRVIVIRQSQAGHREIEGHYAEWLKPVVDVSVAIPQLISQQLQAKLDEPTRIEFIETPLKDVVAYLRDAHDVPIRLDQQSLDEVGLTNDVPVTFNVRGIPLRSALSLLLRDLELMWTADQAEITITTPEAACAETVLVEYPLQGIMPPADRDSLIDAIQSTVSPSNWAPVGGPGSVKLGPRGTLLVQQQFPTHGEVAMLLEEMREALK